MTTCITYMESKRSKNIQQHIGRSKTKNTPICKKHPKHKQSPGVCAICLREKLSQLSNSRNNVIKGSKSRNKKVSSCSSSSLSSLSSSSSCSTPRHRSYLTRGSSSSMAFLRSGKNTVFTKSKSMAFVMQREGEATDHGKKKRGFWSKLLRPRSKEMHEGLMHSRTMRE